MLFKDLGLISSLLKAVEQEGYTQPTPIQQQAIPSLLEGRDLLGCAQTGTGKTAAFAIPILQLMHNRMEAQGASAIDNGSSPAGMTGNNKPQTPAHTRREITSTVPAVRALILTPTRELAIQVQESFEAYGRFTGLKSAVIFGGVSQQKQVDEIRRGIDILVATPGRLLDLLGQRLLSLAKVEFLVLDEADRMLDMGFIHDVKKILVQVPVQRQSLFFSATMAPEIRKLADAILRKPVYVEVTPVSTSAETVTQSVYMVEKSRKQQLLTHLLQEGNISQALVFTRTKHGANKVAGDLEKKGITAEAIHGNKSQNARQRALQNFKDNTTRVLVATDIAARGIDFEALTHVINFELPNIPETYVHRIGRTGRAGATGAALSFCNSEEIPFLKDIQKTIHRSIPVEELSPFTGLENNIPGNHSASSQGYNRTPGKSGAPAPHRKKQVVLSKDSAGKSFQQGRAAGHSSKRISTSY